MNRNRYFTTLSLLVIFSLNAVSQVFFTGNVLASDLTRGMELFNKEKYAAAIRLLDSFIRDNEDQNNILVSEAEYYRSAASIALFNPDAEYRMVSYIRTHPESPRINEAYLALGDYFYQNKNYRKAVPYFEEVNRQ